MGEGGDGEPEIGFRELGNRVWFAVFWPGVSWKFIYSYSALTIEHSTMEVGRGQGYAGAGPIKISGSLQTGSIPLVV